MTARRQEPSGCVGQPVLLELLDDLGEELRRHGEVEGEVAAGAPGRLSSSSTAARSCSNAVVVVEVAGDEPHALGELLPDLLAERRAGVLLHRVVDDLREVLVLPVAAGEPDEREARRQQTAVGQVVDGGHQLLAGQVARHAEDDQPGRPRDPREPAVARGHAAGCCQSATKRARPSFRRCDGRLQLSALVTARAGRSRPPRTSSTPSSSSSCTTSSYEIPSFSTASRSARACS